MAKKERPEYRSSYSIVLHVHNPRGSLKFEMLPSGSMGIFDNFATWAESTSLDFLSFWIRGHSSELSKQFCQVNINNRF